MTQESWASGTAYEPYVGRWSRLVAREFLKWLETPDGYAWLDVGCGTGALSQTILDVAKPKALAGIDASEGFIAHAREHIRDDRARFEVADAQSLPVETNSCDAAVSGLVLNFVPQPSLMVSEMNRAVRRGGTVALYVWDYAGKMQLMRHFWDAVVALEPEASPKDEGVRFPVCKPEPLAALFTQAGLAEVKVQAVDVPTHFRNFDDYWNPFLGGQAPAPAYVMSLNDDERIALREYLRQHLPIAADGSIPLIARAWAVRGTVKQ